MRAVSFNVHHGTLGASGPVDPVRLGEVCAGFDADVLALQEIECGVARSGRVDLPAVVAEATGLALVFDPVRRVEGGRYGNALLVRGSFVQSASLRLYRPRLRFRGERRRAIEVLAHLDRPRLDVWIVASHLSIEPDEVDRQLTEVVDRTARRPVPKLLLGDLNRRPPHVEAAAAGTGLTVADLSLPTYPADGPRIRIDHLLVGGLHVDRVSVPEVAVSDHRPLVVDLTVPATR